MTEPDQNQLDPRLATGRDTGPSKPKDPAQTVRRLRDAGRERTEEHRRRTEAIRPTGPLREDPMMSLPERPRRKRCRHCRYRFDYRMRTNLCPECGRYRDDYPHPNHGLAAMAFGGLVVLSASIVVAVVLVLQGV